MTKRANFEQELHDAQEARMARARAALEEMDQQTWDDAEARGLYSDRLRTEWGRGMRPAVMTAMEDYEVTVCNLRRAEPRVCVMCAHGQYHGVEFRCELSGGPTWDDGRETEMVCDRFEAV